jgi:hypothetical protein
MSVADAVTYEPASIAKFPANREKNREFFNLRVRSRLRGLDTCNYSRTQSEIPYSSEQGIFAKEQGI